MAVGKILPWVMVAFVTACGPTNAPVPATQAISPTNTAVTQNAGFETAINRFRAGAGHGPVARNAALDRAARGHADDMVKRGYFAHVSPEGGAFSDRAKTAGCAMQAGAENIAAGQRSEAEVFDAWANSPGHRRNMLGASYTQYGLGRIGDTWVLVLASRC